MKSFLELVEETNKTSKPVVTTFGRMNPPTTGHLKLINKVREISDREKMPHSVVVSHSQNASKNPLSPEQKVKHLRRYSPGTNFSSSSSDEPTILHHAAKLHAKGHDHLVVVAGSDRVKEMHDLLHKYNGVKGRHGHFNFKKIEVRSAGHRDPDAEGEEGMSGTKMRQHAKNKDFSSFRQGVPSHVKDDHARELMHDVRHGMGLHENFTRGMYKAIFVTGGPGSGKDIVIREAISEARATELNVVQAYAYLADKKKLSEKTHDLRRESIRSRSPLIINGPADDNEHISYIKEELEELGYSTMMIFVDTTNESSQERNTKLYRMMVESVRNDKWLQAQHNKDIYSEEFDTFLRIDNSGSVDMIEEDITSAYKITNAFFDGDNKNNIYRNKNIFVESVKLKKLGGETADTTSDVVPDNSPSMKGQDDIKFNAPKRTKTYTNMTYSEDSKPHITINAKPKVPNFNKDKESEKAKKSKWLNSSERFPKPSGTSPEFDTRQSGTAYPGGINIGIYQEGRKSFKNFVESIDEPGGTEMGVGGVLGGSCNKEPMQTQQDNVNKLSGVEIKQPKKRKKYGE